MGDENLALKLWNIVKGWAEQNADHHLYVPILKGRTDESYDDSPLIADRSYLRLWLVEMFLTKKRNWFTDWFPAVHSSIQLKFGDHENVKLSHVAQAPENALSESVLLNFPVTELVPFRGGVLELEGSLLAMKGQNYLTTAISVLQSFSGLVVAPLDQVLTVAEKVSSGMQELLGTTQGQVHLGLHQAFTSAGGGGNPLKPGYFAVILATANEVKNTGDLTIKNTRLHYRGTPFADHAYMLYKIEGRQERDDWRLKNIQEPLDKAIEALIQGEKTKADAFKRVALIAAMQSSDLSIYDRRRVAKAILAEYDEIAELGLGAVGDTIRDMNAILAARAIPIKQAIAEGELTFDELFEE